MRSTPFTSWQARLFSLLALATQSGGCGWIAPQAPDGQVVSPLEAGAATDADQDPPDGDAPTADADVEDADTATDAGPAEDAAQPDAAPQADAAPDAGSDAGPTPPPYAGCDAGACGDAGPPACNADDQCDDSAYCSKVSHQCMPRCDAQQTCIGPRLAASNNRLLSDGRHVCYADTSDRPGEYTIMSWDGDSEPRVLGSGAAATVLLVADGHCYYHASGALQRAALTGGAPETLQAQTSVPRRSWQDATHLWWTLVSGDQLQLFRLGRSPGAAPELVTTGPVADSWEASNSTHLFRRFIPSYAKCAIAMAPIADPGSVTVIPMSFSKNCTGAFWASDESILFTQFEPVRHFLFRVDLASPSEEKGVSLYSVEPLMYQVRGDFVYGQRVVDGSNVPGVPNTVSYWRASLDGSAGELLFTPTPGTAEFYVEPYDFQNNVHRTYAVLDDLRLIYQHKTEQRLLVHALPPEPAR